jgi:pimeloyl-ACP methyl ester carboxylesterase
MALQGEGMNTNDDVRMEAQPKGAIKGNTVQLSHRSMLKGSGAMLGALGLIGTTGFGNSQDMQAKEREHVVEHTSKARPRIVLVHGAWADGTGWQQLIPLLEDEGYPVIAVQNPLSSLVDGVTTTKRVIDAEGAKGPVIVVGHSYGGAVITGAAAGNTNVKALVYIAAFAPAVGEPIGALLPTYPTELGAILEPDAAGFAYLNRERFHDVFCADVDRTTARVMAAAQKPAFGGIFAESLAAVAWETIPAWYMVAKEDKALSPDMERFLAERMHAKTVEVKASHVVFISKPREVFKLIEKAAKAVS